MHLNTHNNNYNATDKRLSGRPPPPSAARWISLEYSYMYTSHEMAIIILLCVYIYIYTQYIQYI